MKDIFKLNDKSCNTRNNPNFQRRNIKIVLYESEYLSALGPQVWDLIPPDKRNLASP